MIRGGTIYPTKMGRLKMAEPLPKSPRDSQLILDKGRYYLCVPYKATVQRGDNQSRIVSLDPGVHTFMSYYCPESAGKLGEYDFGRIARLCQHLDKLISRIDTLRKKSVRSMLTWSHYKFQQRIKSMAQAAGTTVLPIDESYTSKTVN